MVFCKACDKYLKLLHQKNQAVHFEQDNEQDLIADIIRFCGLPVKKQKFLDKMLSLSLYFKIYGTWILQIMHGLLLHLYERLLNNALPLLHNPL